MTIRIEASTSFLSISYSNFSSEPRPERNAFVVNHDNHIRVYLKDESNTTSTIEDCLEIFISEVILALKNRKNKKAADPDEVPIELLKAFEEENLKN